MGRRLRAHVVERQALVVLINDVRRDFFVDDLLEDGLCHGSLDCKCRRIGAARVRSQRL
jgi:hypothetical protein